MNFFLNEWNDECSPVIYRFKKNVPSAYLELIAIKRDEDREDEIRCFNLFYVPYKTRTKTGKAILLGRVYLKISDLCKIIM